MLRSASMETKCFDFGSGVRCRCVCSARCPRPFRKKNKVFTQFRRLAARWQELSVRNFASGQGTVLQPYWMYGKKPCRSHGGKGPATTADTRAVSRSIYKKIAGSRGSAPVARRSGRNTHAAHGAKSLSVPNRHPQMAESPAASAAKALAPPHRGGSQGLSVSSRGKLRTCRRPAQRRRPVPRTGPSAPAPLRRGTGCGPWIPHGPSPTPSCAWSVLRTGHTGRGWP